MLESVLIKFQAFRLAKRPAILLKIDSNSGVSCEICETFKNTCFKEHLRTTASVLVCLVQHSHLQHSHLAQHSLSFIMLKND